MAKGKANGGFTLLRLLAVVSAIGLAGAYVWFRQSQAAPAPAPPAPAAEASGEPVGESAGPSVEERFMMSGSKSPGGSLHLTPDGGAVWTIPDPEPPARTILPGSKSTVVMPEVDPFAPTGNDGETAPEEGAPAPRTVLPGSKSIDRVLFPRDAQRQETETPEPEPPKQE